MNPDSDSSDQGNSDSNSTDSGSPYTLDDRVYRNLQPSKFQNEPKRSYLPEGRINCLITEKTIIAELNNFSEAEDFSSLVKFILEKATKVFALTCVVLSDKNVYEAMKKFQTSNFNDQDLPVRFKRRHCIESDSGVFEDKRLWTPRRSIEFQEKQWMFLAPVFLGLAFMHGMDENSILLFKQVGADAKKGTFGDVYKVKIHPDHMDQLFLNRNGASQYVAVKEITPKRSSQVDAADAFRLETKALSKCRHVKHKNLLPCLAAIEKGFTYYFLFPWADGGSLLDFWKRNPKPELTPVFVRAILEQLYGLSEAVEKLHNYVGDGDSSPDDTDPETRCQGSGGIRHGDLKPENILLFNSAGDSCIGTLKIADMGLAKHHDVNTRLRKNMTSTKYGTRRYESPEVEMPRLRDRPTSRLYDTWSMGCIILELIVWMLYGQKNLDIFNESVREGINHDSEPPYYKLIEGKAKVHHQVIKYLETLARDGDCKIGETALGDLLAIARDKLLVVRLPPGDEERFETNGDVTIVHTPSPIEESDSPCRATAKILRESLGKILGNAQNDPEYLFKGNMRRPLQGNVPNLKTESSSSLHPKIALDRVPKQQQTQNQSSTLTRMKAFPDYKHRELDIKVWEFTTDDKFATRFLNSLETLNPPTELPRVPDKSLVCNNCKALNFWGPPFKLRDDLFHLKRDKQDCNFCEMRWEACKHLEGIAESAVFERTGSVIKLNESDPPVFSIFGSRDPENSNQIPIGRPVLQTSPKSKSQFQLINHWLENCDANHHLTCQPRLDHGEDPSIQNGDSEMNDIDAKVSHSFDSRRSDRLPKRLIDLGTDSVPVVRLYETQDGDRLQDFKYAALSHPWGKPTKSNPHFCTTKDNRDAHLVKIEFEDLPNTFKDAVMVTKNIGVRYLWIDSICVIQGAGGDFNTESQQMEHIFSSAYCVIAASRATGQCDGFLKDRMESSKNHAVKFQHGKESPFYVGRFLDNFTGDVLEGSLNQRGWVLQERALARRTIYFTETQTYWECGDGVRCETLTKMKNQLAAFLGDSNFPDVAIRLSASQKATSRGQRILYYQNLYKTYSRLQFTHWEDRAIAMNGLEQRLSRGFQCRGKFGILDDSARAQHGSLLHRSLLWHRDIDNGSLEKIMFPPDRERLPTWSWMAFQGAIDYLDVPFNEVEWDAELKSPWQATETQSASRSEVPEIRATGRHMLGKSTKDDVELFFDSTGQSQPRVLSPLCVIVGKAKSFAGVKGRMHYILIVRPTGTVGVEQVVACERIGVGRIPGNCIDFEAPRLDLRIH